MYEVGRHGAFDISTDPPRHSLEYASIFPPRPDLEAYSETRRNLKWIVGAVATAAILILGVMLISSTAAATIVKLTSSKWFWITLAITGLASYGAVAWVKWLMPEVAESEPFILTEGISAWPTAAIGAFALLMSVIFLWYSWRRLKTSETALAHEFGLEDETAKIKVPKRKSGRTMRILQRSSTAVVASIRIFGRAARYMMGLEDWRQQTPGHFEAAHLWHEYIILGNAGNLAVALPAASRDRLVLRMADDGIARFSQHPMPGSACFIINDGIIILSIAAIMLLIFYVIDVTLPAVVGQLYCHE